MNDPDILTLNDYRIYANSLGIYENLEIEAQYKLYLALITNDMKVIKKATNTYYYNSYQRLTGRLN